MNTEKAKVYVYVCECSDIKKVGQDMTIMADLHNGKDTKVVDYSLQKHFEAQERLEAL